MALEDQRNLVALDFYSGYGMIPLEIRPIPDSLPWSAWGYSADILDCRANPSCDVRERLRDELVVFQDIRFHPLGQRAYEIPAASFAESLLSGSFPNGVTIDVADSLGVWIELVDADERAAPRIRIEG